MLLAGDSVTGGRCMAMTAGDLEPGDNPARDQRCCCH
jgi:hypothetical protein